MRTAWLPLLGMIIIAWPGPYRRRCSIPGDASPLDTAGSAFIVGRLADAKGQVRGNASDARRHEEFRRAIADAPVVPVFVLHSASPVAGSSRWLEEDGVTIVQDGYLQNWLSTVNGAEALDAHGTVAVPADLVVFHPPHSQPRDQGDWRLGVRPAPACRDWPRCGSSQSSEPSVVG